MKVRPRKELSEVKPSSLKRIEAYYNELYYKKYSYELEKNGRIMLDLYLKMACVTLYDKCEMSEEEIYLFLGHHRELFQDQIKKVRSGEQIDYLDRRMKEIFKTKGFPQGFFDKMLGKVETENTEQNTAEVSNDSADNVCNAFLRNNWISVLDHVPETSGKYIIYTNRGITYTAVYNAELGKWNGQLNKSVTYWMPLPDAPQSERSEE